MKKINQIRAWIGMEAARFYRVWSGRLLNVEQGIDP